MAMIGEVQTPAVNWGVTGLTDVTCTVIDLINETTETPSVSEVGSLGTYKANWTPSVENFFLIIFTSEAANKRSTIWWPVNKGMLYRAHGLFYTGTCDSGMAGSQTVIVCKHLAGFGDDYFNTEWSMKVILNANNHGVAPEGTAAKDITDYVSLTGTFTVASFGANVEAGDVILIQHAAISGGDATAANQAIIIAYVDDLEARLTALRAGYLDKLVQTFQTTIDLQQAAGTYDIATATAQDILVKSLVFHTRLDISDDAAITGISIQTDHTTPNYLIPAEKGIKANMGAEAQLFWEGTILLRVGDKIQFTIIGGTATDPSTCDVVITYQPCTAGGTLA